MDKASKPVALQDIDYSEVEWRVRGALGAMLPAGRPTIDEDVDLHQFIANYVVASLIHQLRRQIQHVPGHLPKDYIVALGRLGRHLAESVGIEACDYHEAGNQAEAARQRCHQIEADIALGQRKLIGFKAADEVAQETYTGALQGVEETIADLRSPSAKTAAELQALSDVVAYCDAALRVVTRNAARREEQQNALVALHASLGPASDEVEASQARYAEARRQLNSGFGSALLQFGREFNVIAGHIGHFAALRAEVEQDAANFNKRALKAKIRAAFAGSEGDHQRRSDLMRDINKSSPRKDRRLPVSGGDMDDIAMRLAEQRYQSYALQSLAQKGVKASHVHIDDLDSLFNVDFGELPAHRGNTGMRTVAGLGVALVVVLAVGAQSQQGQAIGDAPAIGNAAIRALVINGAFEQWARLDCDAALENATAAARPTVFSASYEGVTDTVQLIPEGNDTSVKSIADAVEDQGVLTAGEYCRAPDRYNTIILRHMEGVFAQRAVPDRRANADAHTPG